MKMFDKNQAFSDFKATLSTKEEIVERIR